MSSEGISSAVLCFARLLGRDSAIGAHRMGWWGCPVSQYQGVYLVVTGFNVMVFIGWGFQGCAVGLKCMQESFDVIQLCKNHIKIRRFR